MHFSALRRRALVTVVACLGVTGLVVADATTSRADSPPVAAGGVLRLSVPEAIGGKTVIGQLAVDGAREAGFVTAYGCDHGLPRAADGKITRADLNYDGGITPVASNRLIVEADDDGEVCFYTVRRVDMIIDVNAVSFDTGITSFANQRTDTRTGSSAAIAGGGTLRVAVPQAAGGKTVIGQLAVDRATQAGFVTAYGCDDGLPQYANGRISRADLNYDGRVTPVASNRLIVEADDDGDLCFHTVRPVDMIIDINGTADTGVTSFRNRRTDTRSTAAPVAGGGVLRVNVPEALGGKTVIGQLAVDGVTQAGFVTAYGCDDGLPQYPSGRIRRADLNYDGAVTSVASNRLIVQADGDGDICFFTVRPVEMIIDINAVSGTGITSFVNRRTDTRSGTLPPGTIVPPSGVPVWPPYHPLPQLNGVAALTGEPASASITRRPIVAVKIDNYRRARPQWGLDVADVVFEENVEGVTRFIALFHTRQPADVGPVRSARTGDLDLLSGMNRPVFAYSGANPGVTSWVESAANSGVLVDFTALRNPCYRRDPIRPGPHNLVLDSACAVGRSPAAGPARPLWTIDQAWTVPGGVASSVDTTFNVPMDGVRVDWSWDAATARYLRSQDGAPHLADSGARISARTVVEVFAEHVPSTVDARSPNPITVGTGVAVVHRDGRSVAGTWTRPTPYSSFTFSHPTTGVELPVDSGTTFVELVRDR